MITFLGFVVLMAAFSHGVDSICDVTQDAVCNGTLGLPVYLQLIRDATGHELKLFSGDKNVFTSKSSKTVFFNEFNNPSYLQRWQFVRDNGTLIINPAEKRDAGTYRVEIYEESTGRSVGDHTVQLILQGTSTVSVKPTNQTNTTLPSTHPGPSVTVIVICVLLSLTVCLCVAVGTFYIRMKKRNTHTPVSEKKEPDDLVYAQVTTGSNGRRQISDIQGTRVETEDVVYSGVAMANRSSRHNSRKPPAAEAYELEYAEVSAFSKRRGPTESHRPEESVEYGEVRVHTPH
ncbi:uncharacterized protein LOC116219803 isoform X1 [Clupea harengus]|uniref:Uncharacterized protein LOC116219803 isoform X1 n=1 Tax=Clupea harengus TaxID=7950 RepID=A0A6P8F6S3_CLUHA|nr:uncharacterized protein LOC116219803 isoform X1 [Clupea harengus]